MRELVLVYDFNQQQADMEEIRRRLRRRNTRVLNRIQARYLPYDSERVVICVRNLPYDRGGLLLCGTSFASKIWEYEHLAAVGAPVARTKLLTAGGCLDDSWPEELVVKPDEGFQGRGVRWCRRDELHMRGRTRRPYVAQEYIPSGPPPTSHRIATFLGEVLYATVIQNHAPGAVASNDHHYTTKGMAPITEDMRSVARRATMAFPKIPFLGVDVVPDSRDGSLKIVEVNSRGWTWHFSSQYGRLEQNRHGIDFAAQNDAMGVAAFAIKRLLDEEET